MTVSPTGPIQSIETRVSKLEESLEIRIHKLEESLADLKERHSVLEAKIPLQLEMILNLVNTLNTNVRDLLTRLTELEQAPGRQAQEKLRESRDDKRHVLREIGVEGLKYGIAFVILYLGLQTVQIVKPQPENMQRVPQVSQGGH